MIPLKDKIKLFILIYIGWGLYSSLIWAIRITFLVMTNDIIIQYENNKFIHIEYALQWKGKEKESKWSLLRVNTVTGKIKGVSNGEGYHEYIDLLRILNIEQKDIFWGGKAMIDSIYNKNIFKFKSFTSMSR